MNTPPKPGPEIEEQGSTRLLDLMIRAALIGAMALLCYQIFSPFLALMVWSIIFAVAMYPLHQWIARKLGGKQSLASIVLVTVGILLILAPTALLLSSFGDSVREFIGAVQHNTLAIPAPKENVATWPVVGPTIYDVWSRAHTDLPGLVQSMQPKIGELAAKSLSIVASIGTGLLLFLASFIVSGIVMAYGEAGARSSEAIFVRVVGAERGEALLRLSAATIRAVAQGVIGVAFIQAILIGVILLVCGVPGAGVLAIIALVLGIAQVPALLVTIPVIGYIWSSGAYGNTAAIIATIVLLVAGMADNVLKPLMLGRGVDVPMPVILLGALGGMASGGIVGLFVGATVLALGYEIFMNWVGNDPEASPGTPQLAEQSTEGPIAT
ncbi:MAG TPA: AI-2E family transporter [Blastocatellia bacterium]|nr:AI-2E family transporter [Blastocatellia bacterium]